jgi:hypothetical protein
MDWRLVLAALTLGLTGLTALLLFVIVNSGSAPVTQDLASSPVLYASRAEPALIQAPDPRPVAPTRPSARLPDPLPAASFEAVPTQSLPEPVQRPRAARRKASDEIMQQQMIDRPPAEPEARFAALGPVRTRERPVDALTSAAPVSPQLPPVVRPRRDLRYEGILTPAEIARMKAALRLTPEQEGYWRPVEPILREIGAQQMAQVDAGQKPDFNIGVGMQMRLYREGSPLLRRLREDQKVEVRKRARSMGLERMASML